MAPLDSVVRTGRPTWRWATAHPHWNLPADPTNTLYVASERLSLPGDRLNGCPGSGVFDFADPTRRLTRQDATSPSQWALPVGFLPGGRPALSYHVSPDRWSQSGQQAHLTAVARGQEFVLDLDLYPELVDWLVGLIGGAPA